MDTASDAGIHLAELAAAPSVQGAVEAVREFLDMEVAFVGEISRDSEIFRFVCGDTESFGFEEGARLNLEETYCQRVLRGRLPNLITDARADPRAASLSITGTANVGAFASVPLRFSDGELYGMLCAASHDPAPALGYRELQFLHVFARMVCDLLEREALQRRLHDADLRAAAINVLTAAVDSRDSYTSAHSRAVVDHAVAIALHLGLDQHQIEDVRNVAILHDVGKIAIPDAILRKPGPLTAQEWQVMRTHPVASEQLLLQVPSLRHLARSVRAEHERWDGKGYPDGLAGEEIPLVSRITLVSDAFHALTSDRPYRRALSVPVACAEIEANSGTQFCPRSAAALLAVVQASGTTGGVVPASHGSPEHARPCDRALRA